mgnify:CR=1 FL=1
MSKRSLKANTRPDTKCSKRDNSNDYNVQLFRLSHYAVKLNDYRELLSAVKSTIYANRHKLLILFERFNMSRK